MSQSLEFKIPEGYVFDKDNSTENIIRFKPIKKKITYNDICRELFFNRPSWRLTGSGITNCTLDTIIYPSSMGTSHKQLEQLLALNKLMNVAKYLNGDWEPDFTDFSERKCYITYDFEDLMLDVDFSVYYRYSVVYFESEELARQAIEILGEEEVKKALGVFK